MSMTMRISFLQIVIFAVFSQIALNEQLINPSSCGRTVRNFIVGGQNASENEFPFMASLQAEVSSEPTKIVWMHFCGASILNERWLLTASHCMNSFLESSLWKLSNLRVVIGTNDNQLPNEGNSGQSSAFYKVYTIERIIVHGCYSDSSLADDIALLKIEDKIEIDNKRIGTICLPPQGKGPQDKPVQLAGWGVWAETSSLSELNGEREKGSRFLRKADTKLMSEIYCEHYMYYRQLGMMDGPSNWILGKRICVVSQHMTACRGDSGGPAFQKINGGYYQIGVASFISTSFFDNTCHKANPVVYVDVSMYIDWIESSIQKYSNSKEDKIKSKCN